MDVSGIMKDKLIVLEVVAEMLGGKTSESPQPGQQLNEDPTDARFLSKSGPEMTDEGSAAWMRRSQKSKSMYSWYKKSSNKRYNVVNLDTRDPEEFKKNIARFK